MRMRGRRVLPVLLLACALVSRATFAVAAEPEAGRCRTLTYSTNPHYPPYDWAVGETDFDGASIDLLRLAVPPGVALKPVVLPWKRALALAREGKIDLLVSLRITPERSEYLRFTRHRAFPNPIVVFVRKDRIFPFKSWADLKGRRGGKSLGDTFGGGFDEYWRRELSLEDSPSMENNFEKLEAGRIDYFVTSKYVGEAYAASHRLPHGVVSLNPPISEMDIHFGFSRASPCAALVEQMDLRLEELDRRGIPEQLLRKHLRRFKARSAPAQE
jgi:ABC-type amino acid transport/signal transduction systems, periplasmic component/domain